MDPMVIYLGAAALFVLGALLFRNTSIYEFVGGTEYESKRRRRFAGVTLMALAVICGGVEMLSQSNALSDDIPRRCCSKRRSRSWRRRELADSRIRIFEQNRVSQRGDELSCFKVASLDEAPRAGPVRCCGRLPSFCSNDCWTRRWTR